MDDPLAEEARFRRASRATHRAMWFSGAFALFFGTLAALSWAGLTGEPHEASLLLLMAFGGVALFVAGRVAIWFFES